MVTRAILEIGRDRLEQEASLLDWGLEVGATLVGPTEGAREERKRV
eukprot:UN01464